MNFLSLACTIVFILKVSKKHISNVKTDRLSVFNIVAMSDVPDPGGLVTQVSVSPPRRSGAVEPNRNSSKASDQNASRESLSESTSAPMQIDSDELLAKFRAASPTPEYRKQLEAFQNLDKVCDDVQQSQIKLGQWQDRDMAASNSQWVNSQDWQNGQNEPLNLISQKSHESQQSPIPTQSTTSQPRSFAAVTSDKVDLSSVNWRDAQASTLVFHLTKDYKGRYFGADKLHDILNRIPDLDVKKYKPVSCGHVHHGTEFHFTLESRQLAMELGMKIGGRLMEGNNLVANVTLGSHIINNMRIHWVPQWVSDDMVKTELQRVLSATISSDTVVLDVNQGHQTTKWGQVGALYRQVSVQVPRAADIGRTPCFIEIDNYKAMITVFGQKDYCFKCLSRDNHKKDEECTFHCVTCIKAKQHDMSRTHSTKNHDKHMETENSRREARAAAAKQKQEAVKMAGSHVDNKTEEIRNAKRQATEKNSKKSKKSKAQQDTGSSVDEHGSDADVSSDDTDRKLSNSVT